jgi:hypothetical protein
MEIPFTQISARQRLKLDGQGRERLPRLPTVCLPWESRLDSRLAGLYIVQTVICIGADSRT